MNAKPNAIPQRSEIDGRFTWNLSGLFSTEAAWEQARTELEGLLSGIESFRGRLGQSAESLRSALDYMNRVGILDERLGSYAHLRLSEDAGDSRNQDRFARYLALAARVESLASYQAPEIQAIPEEIIEAFLREEVLADHVVSLRKVLRFKPHILSEREERLLAMQTEVNQTASKAFSALTDVDLDFGQVETPDGPRPLSQSTYSSFLINSDRAVRERAYFQFYGAFESHRNTLAALYAGSVQLDLYRARIRNYPSARAAALFPDKVPEEVYDNLIATVGINLDALHAYYELRRRALEIEKLRLFDVYVPLVKDLTVTHTYEQAVDLVIPALAPLGPEYCETLKNGLSGGWVDRYENKGKRSGAFSAGSFTGDPYILLNYKEDVLRDVFTMAHEGGHSMHSWYSVRNNPFQHYSYTIFEAEVASTFNEELLATYLYQRAESDAMRAYLIGKQVDDIIATIFRQSMFAEFEQLTHAMVESGGALTVDSLRSEYGKLLRKYFGPEMTIEEASDLEGLRIPHFYRAFYVYKYATGMAASIALSRRVLEGGANEREAYLSFLKSGGSRYPLESLALAGVDMASPQPIQAALDHFRELLKRLEMLLPRETP